MKVKELIELLQKMPQDLEVISEDGHGYYFPTPRVIQLDDSLKASYDMHNSDYIEI